MEICQWHWWGKSTCSQLSLQGDRSLPVSRNPLGKMVLSRNDCLLVILWKILPIHSVGPLGDRALQCVNCWGFLGHRALWVDISRQKIIWKSLFIGETGKDSANSVFRSPRRQCSLNQCSTIQKMVLKWPFVSDTGKILCMFIVQSARRLRSWVQYRSILKGDLVLKCLLGTPDKILFIHPVGLPESDFFELIRVLSENHHEIAIHWWHQVRLYTFIVYVSWETEFSELTRVLLRRWSWNGHSWVTMGKRVKMFIVQVSWDTELSETEVLLDRW